MMSDRAIRATRSVRDVEAARHRGGTGLGAVTTSRRVLLNDIDRSRTMGLQNPPPLGADDYLPQMPRPGRGLPTTTIDR